MDEVTRMAYAGEVPWHGKGDKMPQLATAKEARDFFSWTVTTAPGFVTIGESHVEIPDLFAIYREDTGEVLGTATGLYTPMQNSRMIDLAESFVQDRLAVFETLIELRGGKECIALLRLPEDLLVGGKSGDRYQRYIMLSTGHDGKHGFHIKRTKVRVVCANTQHEALAGPGKHFKVEHYGDIEPRLKEAQRMFEVAENADKQLARWYEYLAAQKVKDEKFADVSVALFGDHTDEAASVSNIRRNQAERFYEMWDEESKAFGKNAYSVRNAVTGMANFGFPIRKNETGDERMVASLDGITADFIGRGEQTMIKVLELKPLSAMVAV